MKKLLVAAVAIATVFAWSPADAGMVMRLTQGASSVTITDNGAGDINATVGEITWQGALGVFTTNVTVGLSKPSLPNTPVFAKMDMTSVNVSGGPGTIKIELTDTDFAAMPDPPGGQLIASVGGTTRGTAEFWAYKDPNNQEFGLGPINAHLGPFSPVAFSGTGMAPHGPLANPYSMTLVAELNHGAGIGVNTSFNFEVVNVVPEPATLALLGLGLAGAGMASRRRKSKK